VFVDCARRGATIEQAGLTFGAAAAHPFPGCPRDHADGLGRLRVLTRSTSVDLYRQGTLDLDAMVSSSLSLTDVDAAFAALAKGGRPQRDRP